MNISTIKRASIIVVLCLGVTALIYAGGRWRVRNGGVPIEISLNPTTPLANHEVQVTVTMDEVASSDEALTIGCTDSYSYSSLPSEVTVPAGYSSVTFTAETSNYYSTGSLITATCNSVSSISNGSK